MKKLLSLLLVLLLCVGVFAACKDDDNEGTETPIESALSYVVAMYSGKAETTAASYNLIAAAPGNDGNYYDVVWTVVGEVNGVSVETDATKKVATIVITDKALEEITYKLKATITNANGESVSAEFGPFKVPKYKVNTYAEYAAAENEATLVVQGLISGIFSKTTGSQANGLYIQDINGEGGYYVYGLSTDPVTDGLKVGQTVEVKGAKDNYNGTYELVDATVTVIDSTVKAVTPVDFTTIYQNAADLKADALVGKQGMLVTIKGVTVGDIGDNGYHYFTLGEKTSYLRISSSNNATDKDSLETIEDLFKDKKGYVADVTGVISIYSGNFYLSPVSADALSNFALPVLDEAGEIAHEIDKLAIPSYVIENGEITLIAEGVDYPDVKFTWSENSDNLAYDATTGKLTVTLTAENAVLATVSYTAKSGDVEVTGEVEIAIIDPCNNLFKLLAASYGAKFENVTLTGVITSIDTAYDSQYKNVTVTIAVGEAYGAPVQLYRLALSKETGAFTYDLATLAVGDTVTAVGSLGSYKGKIQVEKGILTAVKTQAATLTEVKALESGASLSGALTGEVISIDNAYNSQYGNVSLTILVGETEIGAYRIIGEWASEVEVGDTITIMGVIENNATHGVQFKQNSVIVDYTEGTDYIPQLVTTAPTAGTEYYIGVNYQGANNFLTGDVGNAEYRLAFDKAIANAVAFELEATTGGFYLKTTVGGATKYLNIVINGNYVNNLYQDTAASVWVWNDTYKTLTVTIPDKGEYAITNTGYANVEAKVVSETTNKAQFYTLVDASNLSNEAKVNYEKDNLSIDTTKVIVNKEITLPLEGSDMGDVTIAWESNNACAVIEGGKVVITLQATAQTVKLTATLSAGEGADLKTATKEFTIEVAAKPTKAPVAVTNFAAGTAYKLVSVIDGKTYYFKSCPNSGKIVVTEDMNEATDLYLEAGANAGEYYIYYMDGTNKVYVTWGSSTNFAASATQPTSAWVYNSELDAWQWGNTNDGRYIGTQTGYSNMGAYAKSNLDPAGSAYEEGRYTAAFFATLEDATN